MLDDAFHALLLAHAARSPDRPALLDEQGDVLTFAGLVAAIDGVRQQLADAGLGRGDRVALLAPDGPDLALLFLGSTAQATAVPLNPRGDVAAMAGFLSDARARALVAPAGDALAERLADRAGIVLLTLRGSLREPSGLRLEGRAGDPVALASPARGDVAYVLGTAGTTGRAKVVPVTHAMVMASCRAMTEWLALGSADRCLNPMPLFHSHGLLNGVIWPLAAGGSVICLHRFDPAALPGLLQRLRPTWTTAVPAILRAMTSALRTAPGGAGWTGLRFVRSSSASLAPELFSELEDVFKAPVIETYGLTETGPLTTSPLGPGGQKPGKVGLPCGPQVRIVDEAGRPVPSGASGEIVAAGPTVARHYESNAAATAEAFRDGWFHTGDLGRFDADGYLVVLGRIKEIIRRGGEGIAPLDVDRALASHPDVVDCACFPIRHPTLGEEVGAAVVLAPGSQVTGEDVRAHVAGLLPAWSAPRVVRVVDALPRSPAGKVIRRSLAAHLGLDAPRVASPSSAAEATKGHLSAIETALMALWAAALGRPVPTLDTDFGLAGGDSLSAVHLAGSVNEVFGTALPLESPLADGRTVARMRDMILAGRGAGSRAPPEDPMGPVPATPGQRRQWLHSLTRRDDPVNVISSAVLLTGRLDRDRLQRAADAAARRHDALRLTFALEAGGEGRTLVQRALAEAPWPIELQAAVPRDRLGVALADAAQRPFALAAGPARRLVLVPVACTPDAHGLCLALHHAVADGWSKEIVLADLARAYALAEADPQPQLPPAPAWIEAARRRDRQHPSQDMLQAARLRLKDLAPTGWGPPEPSADWRARRDRLSLSEKLTSALRERARAHRVTLFALLMAGFADALGLTLGLSEGPITVGVPLANRGPDELHGVGPYSNATLIAVEACPDRAVESLSERLAAVQARVLEAVSMQAVPIESAMPAAGPGAWKRSPLEIPVLFQLQTYDRFERAEAGPLLFERMAFDSGIAQADLSVEIAQENGALACDFVSRLHAGATGPVQDLMMRFADRLALLAGGGSR